MVGLTDFHAHTRGKFGGNPQTRTKDFQDQRIADAHQLHAPPHANAQCFQAICVLVVGLDTADDGAHARRQFIQPHRGHRLFDGVHNASKISQQMFKSNSARPLVDASFAEKLISETTV